MRISAKQVAHKFELFCKVFGYTIGEAKGQMHLTFSPMYGGYNIEMVTNDEGGTSMPFGYHNRGASEMWNTLDFAISTQTHVPFLLGKEHN